MARSYRYTPDNTKSEQQQTKKQAKQSAKVLGRQAKQFLRTIGE